MIWLRCRMRWRTVQVVASFRKVIFDSLFPNGVRAGRLVTVKYTCASSLSYLRSESVLPFLAIVFPFSCSQVDGVLGPFPWAAREVCLPNSGAAQCLPGCCTGDPVVMKYCGRSRVLDWF